VQRAIGAHPSYRPSGLGRTRPRVLPNLAPALPVLRQVLIIACAIFLYFFVRGLVDGREADAIRHADWLIDLEQRLGFFWEPRIQEWALDVGPVDTIANWVYIWAHWPVIAGTLIWLAVRHKGAYATYRNALLLSGAVGLAIFTLYPMAPPRFMDAYGFVDTITLQSHSYRVLQPPSLVNQYAAMPSLHCGWDLLMGLAIARHAPRRLRWIGYALPVAMVAAVVLTANHYLLDAVVGMSLVLVALAAVTAVRRVEWAPRLARTPLRSSPQGS